MFRGEGDRDEAWPEDAALFSDGCSAARGSRSSMAPGGDWGSEGEGIEQGDVANDGGSAWMVIAGKKEGASGEFEVSFCVAEFVDECSKLRSSESTAFCSASTLVKFPVSRSKVGDITFVVRELSFVEGCALGSGVKGGISTYSCKVDTMFSREHDLPRSSTATASWDVTVGHSEFEGSGIDTETLSLRCESPGGVLTKAGDSVLASTWKVVGSWVKFGVAETGEDVFA